MFPITQLDQPSLGLSRTILASANQYEAAIAAYKTYIVEVAKELGSTLSPEIIEEGAQKIIDFEILLANATVPAEERYETQLLYNPYLLNEFEAKLSQVDSDYTVIDQLDGFSFGPS
jgi:membrane metallo-endopeptidase-like protein 1